MKEELKEKVTARKSKCIDDEIEREKQKEELRKIKFSNFVKTMRRTEKAFFSIMRITGIGLFGISLLVLLGLLIWWVFLICTKNDYANTILTVSQAITGWVSLVVGVWALVLTMKSNEASLKTHNRSMNIITSPSNSNPQGKPEEDVNEESLM